MVVVSIRLREQWVSIQVLGFKCCTREEDGVVYLSVDGTGLDLLRFAHLDKKGPAVVVTNNDCVLFDSKHRSVGAVFYVEIPEGHGIRITASSLEGKTQFKAEIVPVFVPCDQLGICL